METTETKTGDVSSSTATGTASEEDKTLSSLLQRGMILMRVFDHLADNGLQECRLVCKHWHQMTRQYATQLRIHRLTDLDHFLCHYPMTTALTFGQTPSTLDNDIDLLRVLQSTNQEVYFAMTTHLMERIRSASHLRHLTLYLTINSAAMDDWEEFFAALDRLELLNISFEDNSEKPCLQLHALRHLTRLTSLSLQCATTNCINDQPLSELVQIRNLCIDFRLAKCEDAWTFPSLTGLSSIFLHNFNPHNKLIREPQVPFTSLIVPYASTLKEVGLIDIMAVATSFYDVRSFDAFSRLEALDFIIDDQTGPDAIEKLNVLTALTRLRIRLRNGMFMPDGRCFDALTGLKSLSCSCCQHYFAELGSFELSGLSGITHLEMKHLAVRCLSLSSMTNLKSLHFSTFHDVLRNESNVLEHLTSLINLENLKLSFCRFQISAAAISSLLKLKRVVLWCEKVDNGLIDHLASLSGLECLKLFITELVGGASFAALNRCKSLVELTLSEQLCTDGSDPQFIFVEGSFPCLRYLHLSGRTFSKVATDELKRRVPTLRKLVIE